MSHEAILREYLLRLARLYAKARGIKMTTVSRLSHGDRHFLNDIAEQAKKDRRRSERTGRQGSMTLRKMDEVIGWFTTPANWPKGNMPALPELQITIGDVRANGQCGDGGKPSTESASTTNSLSS